MTNQPSAKFKIGQVVQLCSGGPTMTIIDAKFSEDSYRYITRWFADADLRQAPFAEETLRTADTPGGAVVVPAKRSR